MWLEVILCSAVNRNSAAALQERIRGLLAEKDVLGAGSEAACTPRSSFVVSLIDRELLCPFVILAQPQSRTDVRFKSY
jgi:hypothetical protein